MKKISLKNLGNAQVLSKDELKKISGGKAQVQCKLAGGVIANCHMSAMDCIDMLDRAGYDVEGCWETTPLPDDTEQSIN